MQIVAADVGGTHARFAIATIEPGRAPQLGEIRKYRAADHATLAAALDVFRSEVDADLPPDAAIAVAGPLGGDLVKFTNSPWVLNPKTLRDDLGFQRLKLLNDFGAMAHAVAWLTDDLAHVGGPAGPLPADCAITLIGPGTGLGVALLLRRAGEWHVVETEGGHLDFAPLDALEDEIVERLRTKFTRVSVERIVSGPGLGNLHLALAGIGGHPVVPVDDKALWDAAIGGDDPLARAALDRFVRSFGAVAGDLALAHGPGAVVITGGLANRVADRLRGPEFIDRFIAKGRHQAMMRRVPIRLACHDEPGLLGAAAAFQHELGASR